MTGGFTKTRLSGAIGMSKVETARRRIETRIYENAIGAAPAGKWKTIVPFLTEHGFGRRRVRQRLGLATPLNTTDRIVLEQVIFPQYSQDPAIRTVLFVGCGTYT